MFFITKKSANKTPAKKAGKRAAKKGAKKVAKNPASKVDGESAVIAAIAAMPDRIAPWASGYHAIIKASAPALTPRLWYRMPGYAKGGKVICFFRGGEKFKERYMTLGFNNEANLDEGDLADRVCADGVNCDRRGEDRRACEEIGELRIELAIGRLVAGGLDSR